MKYFVIFLVLIGFTVHAFAESSEFTVGQVHWLKDSHSADGFAVIQVVDPDMNLSSNDVEKFKIHISSDSDSDGIIPNVYETGVDTGIFESNIYFSEKPSTGQRLHTLEEGLAIALYEDHTLPPPHPSDGKLKILDSIIIRKTFANLDESQNQFMRIDDESFNRQSLQTGETISESGAFVSIFVGSLGPILIVLFIVIYAVKKRMAKKSIGEKK
jgi:hypothetical protein